MVVNHVVGIAEEEFFNIVGAMVTRMIINAREEVVGVARVEAIRVVATTR